MGPILLSKCFPGWKRCFKHIKRHAYWVVVGSASIVVVSKHFQALNCWTFRQNPDRWGPFDWLELRNAAGLGVPKGMTSWWRILAEWDKSKMLEECKDFVYIIHLYIPWISMTRLVHFLRCAHQTFIYSLCFFTPWEIAPLCSFHHIFKKNLHSTLHLGHPLNSSWTWMSMNYVKLRIANGHQSCPSFHPSDLPADSEVWRGRTSRQQSCAKDR